RVRAVGDGGAGAGAAAGQRAGLQPRLGPSPAEERLRRGGPAAPRGAQARPVARSAGVRPRPGVKTGVRGKPGSECNFPWLLPRIGGIEGNCTLTPVFRFPRLGDSEEIAL